MKKLDITIGPLADKMGIKVITANSKKIIGMMPVENNTQLFGLLHGGAYAVLAETLGSIGALLHAKNMNTNNNIAGIEVSASHHKGINCGFVYGLAEAIHLGKSLAHYSILIQNYQKETLSTAKFTAMILK